MDNLERGRTRGGTFTFTTATYLCLLSAVDSAGFFNHGGQHNGTMELTDSTHAAFIHSYYKEYVSFVIFESSPPALLPSVVPLFSK